jgi:hypothetical protein
MFEGGRSTIRLCAIAAIAAAVTIVARPASSRLPDGGGG